MATGLMVKILKFLHPTLKDYLKGVIYSVNPDFASSDSKKECTRTENVVFFD